MKSINEEHNCGLSCIEHGIEKTHPSFKDIIVYSISRFLGTSDEIELVELPLESFQKHTVDKKVLRELLIKDMKHHMDRDNSDIVYYLDNLIKELSLEEEWNVKHVKQN